MNLDWFTIRLAAVFAAFACLIAIHLWIAVYSRDIRKASERAERFAEVFVIGELSPTDQSRRANELLLSLYSADERINKQAWELTCQFLRVLTLIAAAECDVRLNNEFIERTRKLVPFARAIAELYTDWTCALTANARARDIDGDLLVALQLITHFEFSLRAAKA
jgi:hypothetical protein